MLFIITATAILTFILSRIMFYAISKRRRALKLQQLLTRFSELGTANNLSFTSQLILQKSIIGLDGIKRTLLVMEAGTGGNDWYVIRLDEVISCKVKMVYKSLRADAVNEWIDKQHLEKIFISFGMPDQAAGILLPFYESCKSNIHEATSFTTKAHHWESMISKLIDNNLKKIA